MAKQQKPAQAATQQTAAPVVALRGGVAISHVVLGSQVYRTKAPHNQAWWATIQAGIAAAGSSGLAVAPLLQTPANPQGIPAPFFGYCVRRNYLAAPQQAAA